MERERGLHLYIPGSVAEALRLPEKDQEEILLRELALSLYAQGLLSVGKARELAGMDAFVFGQLLGERNISRHYGPDELQDDVSYARGE